MSRIETTFKILKEKKQKALIPYITAGDPDPNYTVDLLHTCVAAGADLIELGIPFSDPMAEGLVIQAAHERALKHHVSLLDVLEIVKKFREKNSITPIVLMGYLNPIEIMGYRKFVDAMDNAGIDGVLLVDLPPEESDELSQLLKNKKLDIIFLVAPTTIPERIKKICEKGSGYHYYVSLKGVTGAGNLDVNSVMQGLEPLKKYAKFPIAVGFGIRDADSARKIAQLADGVIIGAALIQKIAEANSDLPKMKTAITSFLSEIREAI